MERGKENQDERAEEKANISSVLFSALRKDIANVLDFLRKLKNEGNLGALDEDQVEKLKSELAFICAHLQLSYSNLEQFEDVMTAKEQEVEKLLRSILYDVDVYVGCKHDMHHVLASLRDNINHCISSHVHHHAESSTTMLEEQFNFLLLNLYRLSKYFAKEKFPSATQYEILQYVCGNMKDFHGLIVNGCVENEIVECVLPRFQLMAERIGCFFWDDPIDGNSRLFKLAHLFMKIIPIELEVMHMYYTNLKASTSAEVGRFVKQLLETSPDIIREYLIHLQEHMANITTTSISAARNIHIMIEFLLIILSDMSKDFIHHDKLFDLLALVGSLTREVSTLVRNLEEKLRNKESTDETNRATLELLENIELLKEDLKHIYLKAPDSSQCCFPMKDGLLFMHLLHIHLNDLLDSDAYSIALIKEEIGLVKQDLEFIRLFFVNFEQGLYKDLWVRVLDVAYEAKDVIDSIIFRDNGLLHLIFSLPLIIKKVKFIKEDISNLLEKIPKSRSLIVVNSPKKLVESKSLTTDKITVGFEEETHWISRKLTSGLAELDVISITGMPGLGKTTLAYKVYNDISVSSHFDIRAWCTVGQEYDKKKLLVELFNRVTGSDLQVTEDTDVADMLRKQLYGKRFPKDRAMKISVLKNFWRAEGLVEKTEMESVEEVLKVYLDNLISSSLVFLFNEIGFIHQSLWY